MKNLMRRILVFVVLVAIVFGLSPSVPTKAEENIDVTKEIEVQDYIEDFGFDGSYSDDREVETQDPFVGTITYKFHLDDLSFLSINFKPAHYYLDDIDLKLYDSNNKLLLDYDKNPNDMAAGLNNKLLLLNGDYYIKVKSDSIPDPILNYNLGCYELNLIACKMKNIDDLMFNKWPTCYGTSTSFDTVIGRGTFTAVFGGGSADALVYGETYGFTTTDIKAINPYKIKELSFSFNIKNSKSKAKITFSKETQAIRDGKSPSEVYSSTSSTSSTTKTDTKKPTVKGVKNGKTYKKKVKFTVYDKSGIKKVTLNGKKISVKKAKKGYTVKKAKKYTLKVWDKKGNKRTVKFRIK